MKRELSVQNAEAMLYLGNPKEDEFFMDVVTISWDEPINDKCPRCGEQMFRKNTKKPKVYCKAEGCGYEKVDENEGN